MTRVNIFTILACCVVLCAGTAVRAADPVAVSATLIHASNNGKATDGSLRSMEPQLKRIFGYSSHRVMGSGGSRIAVPGSGRVSLGSGHSVTVTPQAREGGRIRYGIQWRSGSSTVVNSTVTRRSGETVLLGGPSHAGGRLILNIRVR